MQVTVVVGKADEGIASLAKKGVRFDLAFLDADKGGYLGYYNQVTCSPKETGSAQVLAQVTILYRSRLRILGQSSLMPCLAKLCWFCYR